MGADSRVTIRPRGFCCDTVSASSARTCDRARPIRAMPERAAPGRTVRGCRRGPHRGVGVRAPCVWRGRGARRGRWRQQGAWRRCASVPLPGRRRRNGPRGRKGPGSTSGRAWPARAATQVRTSSRVGPRDPATVSACDRRRQASAGALIVSLGNLAMRRRIARKRRAATPNQKRSDADPVRRDAHLRRGMPGDAAAWRRSRSLQACGRPVEPQHVRIMPACPEMCRTSAATMLIGTVHHERTGRTCTDLAPERAERCERVSDRGAFAKA